jgi:hypothetical protein
MKQSFAVKEFGAFRVQSFRHHISYQAAGTCRDLASNLATRKEPLKEMQKSRDSEVAEVWHESLSKQKKIRGGEQLETLLNLEAGQVSSRPFVSV